MLTLAGPGAAGAVGTGGRTAPADVAPAASAPLVEDFTEGMRVESSEQYTVDLDSSVVHVDYQATLTNEVPGNADGEYYFAAFAVPLVAEATHVAASRVGGGALGLRMEPSDSEFYSWVVIDLSPNLFYGRPQSVRLTYDLVNQTPRAGSVTQVNRAYATFPVFTEADPGLGSVTVTVPRRAGVEIVGSAMTCTSTLELQTCTATRIDDASTWDATVIARDDDLLESRTIAFGDKEVNLRAWPGDIQWLDFTSDLALRGLPALEGAIGRDWGVRPTLDIVETSAPYIYGYAGWYELKSSSIEIGDELDALVTLHEMAHAWFNEEAFQERWVDEGLADEFAALAMVELGLERPEPDPIVAGSAGALPLAEWSDPALDASEVEEQEAYGYNASWSVIHALVQEIGTDGVAEVYRAAADSLEPYPATTSDARLPWKAEWHTFLDLLEGLGGSTQAEQLFRDYVVSPDEVALMDERATARERYDALLDLGEGWAPPAALRSAMADWDFVAAEAMMPQVITQLKQRQVIATTLASVGEDVPAALQTAFEASSELRTAAGVLDAAQDASVALASAVEAERGADPLTRLGLVVAGAEEDLTAARSHLRDGDYAAAERSAHQARAAVRAGQIVTVICLSPTPRAHPIAFHPDGFWLQQGG
ncbi:MAG: M1 family metallopeptidase, partial [Cellulomonadaceae bacterium]|nr:M1 family metallopeptidase [Cellulomonadaceae bacterium]